MNMENVWIALIQGAFTLLGVYFTTKQSHKKSMQNLEKKVDGLVEDNKDQSLAILRLTIFEENLPISERIIAGDKYLRKGGNGDTKKYYQQMLDEHTK